MKRKPARAYRLFVSGLPGALRKSLHWYGGALLTLYCGMAAANPPDLRSDTATATAGYFQLTWTGSDSTAEFELQESADPGFPGPRRVYSGSDTARVISGRRDGNYYFRIRGRDDAGRTSDWSEPVAVTVAHHSLSRAGFFFATGAVVFLATFALIIAGHRRDAGRQRPG